jgi:hypothetical protein
MHDVISFEPGGYRFIHGSAAFSLGVAALPGYRLERVRFSAPLALEEAFGRMADIIAAAGRPGTALASCELRSPAQFTLEAFGTFNARFGAALQKFGIRDFGDANPVCRTNVCPASHSLTDSSIHAFSYTVEDAAAPLSFVLAGAADLMDGDKDLRELIVAPDQVDAAGIRAKASHALQELERRLALFGADWSMTTANAVYCIHDIFQALTGDIAARGAATAGTTWHLCQPPVAGLEFEMDTRSIPVERIA